METCLHNSLLNASGGGKNFDESFCYLIKKVPENGKWRMLENKENQDIKFRIEDLDKGGLRFLKRIDPTKSTKPLGIT